MSTASLIDRVALYQLARERPEVALLYAVILEALEDAGEGDETAATWLAGAGCLAIVSVLALDDDPAVLQHQLLDRLVDTGGRSEIHHGSSALQE
jgi:hypothetical protein